MNQTPSPDPVPSLSAGTRDALVEYLDTLEQRAERAAREYEVTHDEFRRAFCDGQAHAWGRAAADLAERFALDRGVS